MIMDQYAAWEGSTSLTHRAHAFDTGVLRRIEEFLPTHVEASVETGCGKSTILLSNIANHHRCFAIDDRDSLESSVEFVSRCPS